MDVVSSTHAKQQYFLTPADLAKLPCSLIGGGLGCGAPSRWYRPSDLQEAAHRKHGSMGLQIKQAMRLRRESIKRARKEAADAALLELAPPSDPLATLAPSALNAPASPAADTAELSKSTLALRKSLLKLSKKQMGFTMGGGPKHFRVEVPCVRAANFAALAGRPTDDRLRTCVKNGTYFTHEFDDACELYKCRREELVRFFKRECVGQAICDRLTLKYKSCDGTLSLSGGAVIVPV